MITSNNENEQVQQKNETQSNSIETPTVDPQIQNSIDILNDIIIIQNESLDQGIFYLPDFLDEKINTIKYEPMKIICQSFINFRRKLNKSIEIQLNSKPKNKWKIKKDDDHSIFTHSNNNINKQNSFYSSAVIDINPNQDEESTGTSSDKIENSNSANENINNDNKNDKKENSNENESEYDQSSTSSVIFYENYEIQPRQRSSSDYKKHMANAEKSNSMKIPSLSVQIPHEKSDGEEKIKPQVSTPSQFFKFPSFSKGKSPFHFRNRERALSSVTDNSNVPLFESSPTPSPKISKAQSQFVNDEVKVKKISDSCLNPIPNFASICSSIETIDKILSEFNQTKFDQFANIESRLKNITNNIQSFIRMSNRTKQNLKQIISECQVDSNEEANASKNENEFTHIKKNIQSLLLIKEEQSKKIKQQTKEISYLRTQIESLKFFIKNNQKQISKFKQQFFGNLSESRDNNNNDNDNENELPEINLHLKQRSKSIDFFNSFLLDDENEMQLNDFCNKLRITHEYAQLNTKIKQLDQLLCTIDNEDYNENADIQLRLERMRERISKLYRIDEDQITKNWTFTCAEGAEIENPEIRSYFFEKQYSETEAKLLSLEKQRTKLFELFFSFSNNKNKKESGSNQDEYDDDDDEYITNSISESILTDLNEKNLIIEKKSKMIVEIKKEIELKNKNIESINKKLKQQMKENESLIKKYEEISHKFGESEFQLSSNEKEIKSLNRKVNSYEKKIERLQKHIDDISEKNQKNGSITEIKNISNSLVGELSSVKLLADQQEEAINELYQIKEQLEDELEATKEALKDSMVDIQEKTESLKSVENSLNEEKEKLKMKDLETSEIKSLLEHQIEENEKMKDTIKALTNSSVLSNEADETNANNNDKDDVSDISVISSLQKQINILKDENEKKENQIKELNKQVLASEPRLYTLRRKSLSQKNIISQLTAKTEEIRELIETQYQTEIDQLNKKVDELEYQLQISNKTGQMPIKGQTTSENQNDSIDLNDEVSRLSKENYELQQIIKELKEQKISDEISSNENSQENLNKSNETTMVTIDNENSSQILQVKTQSNKDQSNDEIVIKCDVTYASSSEDQMNNSIKNNNSTTSSNNAININKGNCDASSNQIEKEKNESQCKIKISELTAEIESLKKVNNNLSSELENCKEQLASSQVQLHTIIQLVNNEEQTETKQVNSEPINEDEFSSIVQQLQQNKEIISQYSQKSNKLEKIDNIDQENLSNDENKNEQISPNHPNENIISRSIQLENKQDNNQMNNNSNEELIELQKRIEELEKEKSKETQYSSILSNILGEDINNISQEQLKNRIDSISQTLNNQTTNQSNENNDKNKELIKQEEKEMIEKQYQKEINELTTENETLKETNNNISSELENCKKQLTSSQAQLHTIIQLVNNEEQTDTKQANSEPINEDEFSNIVQQLQQNKEIISQYSQKSNKSEKTGNIDQENLSNDENKNEQISPNQPNENIISRSIQLENKQDNNQMNNNSNDEVIELQKRIEELEKEKSNEIQYSSILSDILGEDINNISQEQLKTRIESISQKLNNQTTNQSNENNDKNKELIKQEEKEMIEKQYQKEINELTTENETLKETNNNLSSKLENSEKQLHTIYQLINNEEQVNSDLKSEKEFSKIIQQLQQNNEIISQISQKSAKPSESNDNDLIIALNNDKSFNSNPTENKNYESEINELKEKVLLLEKENENLKNLSSQKANSSTLPDEYDDTYTICIPTLSKDYGYDSNHFSHDMLTQYGSVSIASMSTVLMENKSDNILSFGFVNFASRSSDTKLFESSNECYYLKSQVIVTNLPFGIKKSDAVRELAKYASSLSINLSESNFKTVFYENSINPEYLIDFKENIKEAKTFVDSFQNLDQENSINISGYIPFAFYYDPCPYKLNENRQKIIQKYASNARLIAMMETEQFRQFDFNSYFNGLTNKSENDTIYSHQIVTNESHESNDQYRLIVDRRFIVSNAYPQFKKLEVVFMNDLEAVLAQTYAMNYSCDILQIFHSNFTGNRIAGNDF